MLPHEIRDYEAPQLIEELVSFLGPKDVQNALTKYKRTKLVSGPIYTQYYLKFRHPWWESFLTYKKLKKKNILHLNYNAPEIIHLSIDSRLISTLKAFMTKSIENKYRKDLLDDEHAINYFFELKTAWHYYRLGYNLEWIDENSSKKPEFIIKKNDIEIEVECKRIGVDAARKIKRPTFYKFCDYVIPKIQEMKLTGNIKITIQKSLSSNDKDLNNLTHQIISYLKEENTESEHELESCKISSNLTTVNGIIVNPYNFVKNFEEYSDPNTHSVILFYGTNNRQSDPIILTVQSESADDYVEIIKTKIKNAAKYQLSKTKPGIINCFIPEIKDFSGLENQGGLYRITSEIFKKRDYNHLLSISFVSDEKFNPTYYGKTTGNPAVIFKNPNCIYKKAIKQSPGLMNNFN